EPMPEIILDQYGCQGGQPALKMRNIFHCFKQPRVAFSVAVDGRKVTSFQPLLKMPFRIPFIQLNADLVAPNIISVSLYHTSRRVLSYQKCKLQIVVIHSKAPNPFQPTQCAGQSLEFFSQSADVVPPDLLDRFL